MEFGSDTIRQLCERKSIRSFTDQDISKEEKEQILMAAAQAPTAGNQQLYTIIDVTDQNLKNALVATCDHQPMIARAKMVLIFCADCKKWYDGFLTSGSIPRKPGEGDLMLAVCDAMIAAQNAVVAAESLGIGSCYIGDIMENCEEQRALLHLPDYVFPAGMLIFGYPTEQQKERTKPERVRMQYIVHENGYQELSGEQLKEMWQPRCGSKSYEDWMHAFCDRKYNSEFSQEMTRSVEKYLNQFEGGQKKEMQATIKGKRIFFLGSSVTYGSAANGVSFADLLQDTTGCISDKEAVSGTTLVDADEESYVARMKKHIFEDRVDLCVCQLSTNDATQKKPMGKVAEGWDLECFDTQTVAGAMEYIICYMRDNYHCNVAFYTSPKYDSPEYEEMVALLYQIREKWNIGILDMWNDEAFNALTEEQRSRYMADPIHPTLEGYRKWWLPLFEKKLPEFTAK